jgi:hypothetical protein
MAWSDAPTEKQISALANFMNYHAPVPTPKANAALKWLEKNATRRQVSDELQRVCRLDVARKLTAENMFDSAVWDSFEFDGDEQPTDKQTGVVFSIINKVVPFVDATMAVYWLKTNSTKKQVSKEIDRLKELQERNNLSKESCFKALIWRGSPVVQKKGEREL